MRCSVPPLALTCRHASRNAGFWKNDPSAMAVEMRTMSCITTRPAPRFRWPTSLFPICPSGTPTRTPDASSSVREPPRQSRSQVGVFDIAIAFPSVCSR
jgi:hypothetical protein